MATVEEIIERVREAGNNVLTEYESKQVLEVVGMPITRQELVTSKGDAVKAASEIGFPVVMKLMAADVVHKSDAGAVKLRLSDGAAVEQAFDELMQIPAEGEKKVSVQEMAPEPITEVIVGMTTDPQFGPALMFGIGGILVEIMKDVSFRIAPITEFDADEMIHEIKGFKILDGYRGKPRADIDALKRLLLQVSDLVTKYDVIDQMDLNPVFVYPDGIKVVDARIILKD
ncbi:MAG: acetate--CoA ligase family protein [Promethearchaeota archaeon]